MSIVDLLGRHTQDIQVFQAHKASDRSLLLSDEGTLIERFSVEFTVGQNWSRNYGEGSNQMVTIPDEGVALAPNASVVIEVGERVAVPFNMYGLVMPTGSLFLDRGIILAAAKIEPAFNGRLKLRLVNTASEKRTVKRGDKVASAIFFATELTTFHEEKGKTIVSVTHLPPRGLRIMRWVRANPPIVIGWIVTFLGSSVAALLITYFLLPPRQAAPSPQAGQHREGGSAGKAVVRTPDGTRGAPR